MQVLTIKRGDLDYLEIEVEKVEFYGERIIVCECRPSLEIYNAVVLGDIKSVTKWGNRCTISISFDKFISLENK